MWMSRGYSYSNKQRTHVATNSKYIWFLVSFCRREATCPPENRPELFKEVDADNVERLKELLVESPNGWTDVKDKVGTARCTIHVLILQYGATLLHHAAGRGSKGCLQHLVEKDRNNVSIVDDVSSFIMPLFIPLKCKFNKLLLCSTTC